MKEKEREARQEQMRKALAESIKRNPESKPLNIDGLGPWLRKIGKELQAKRGTGGKT